MQSRSFWEYSAIQGPSFLMTSLTMYEANFKINMSITIEIPFWCPSQHFVGDRTFSVSESSHSLAYGSPLPRFSFLELRA